MAETRKCDLAGEFREAFDFFNGALFDGKLPQVMITTQRHRGAAGFFRPDSYCGRCFEGDKRKASEETVHEIAIMPDVMWERTDREVLATLVHEMCHLKQEVEGEPSRNGYHNRQWGEYMRAVGLEPTSLGRFDKRNPELSEEARKTAGEGKATGQKVSHFIIPAGLFDQKCAELLQKGFVLTLDQFPELRTETKKSKFKYTCPECGLKAWAKRDVEIVCWSCRKRLEMEDPGDGSEKEKEPSSEK